MDGRADPFALSRWVASSYASTEAIVKGFSELVRSQDLHNRAVVDWKQLVNLCGHSELMQLARALCAPRNSLFVQFVALESGRLEIIPTDAQEFIELFDASCAIRIPHVSFGYAADLVNHHAPSLVSLDFTGFAGDLCASMEIIDTLEAAAGCGAWVSVPSTLQPHEKDWLRERGATLIEHLAQPAPVVALRPASASLPFSCQEMTASV